jgi:hypothetical protein
MEDMAGIANSGIAMYHILQDIYIYTGWWFGTFLIFPNGWDDDPI